jgi:hypothetical protein
MLALKKASDLSWGELKLIENPLTAKNIIESNHGKKVGGEAIHNANNFNLPKAGSRSFDPYGEIHRNLENGAVFLVNSSTTNPVLKNINISEQQRTVCDIAHGQNAMFVNAANAMLARVQVPSVSGVIRQEPSQATNDKPAEQKKEREKHIILLNLEGQNDRPLPIKHNITLVVENTSQGNLPVRQLKEVIYDGFSRVFSSEKGDVFKVYAISDAMLDVKKDLNDNKNLSQSESAGLISALEETGTETRSDGVILHNMKYVVPVPLSLHVGYEFGSKLNKGAVLILQHEDSEWTQSIHLSAGPKERRVEDGDRGWLNVNFEDLPESGKFSLVLHHTNDGSSDVSFFSGVSVEDLPNLFKFESLPLADPIDIPDENLEWADEAKQQEDWLKQASI